MDTLEKQITLRQAVYDLASRIVSPPYGTPAYDRVLDLALDTPVSESDVQALSQRFTSGLVSQRSVAFLEMCSGPLQGPCSPSEMRKQWDKDHSTGGIK